MTEGAIERARSGEREAWTELVTQHLETVHAICRAFGLEMGAAGEVNQAVWLRLVEHLHRIRTPSAVGSWIAATARRECLDRSRASRRSGWITGGLSVPLNDGADPAAIAEGVLVSRSFARMGAACQRLLRLIAAAPAPSAEVIGTALDLPPEDIPAACRSCQDRLERLLRTDPRRRGTLLQGVAGLVAAGDPVPDSWWEAADAAYLWLSIDAVTADVVYDATVSGGGRSNGHSRPGARRCLRFSAGSRQMEVVIDLTTGRREDPGLLLTGRVELAPSYDAVLTPGADVVARWPGGSVPAPVGPDGQFELKDLPLAPLSFQVDGAGQAVASVKTGWIFPDGGWGVLPGPGSRRRMPGPGAPAGTLTRDDQPLLG